MKKWILIAVVLSLALAYTVLAQVPMTREKQSTTAAKTKTFTITGKITKAPQAYVIRGQKPLERYAIMNPEPKVLDRLIKEGKNVTIEAVSVVGDNVNIITIDGKPYSQNKGK